MGLGPVLQQQFLLQRGPLHIGTWGWNTAPFIFAVEGSTGFSSTAWPANNRAYYIPIYVPFRFTVARFMVANGTIVSGTLDAGLYSESGTRLISTGSTSQTGTNVVQYISVTSQSFAPGAYYLALVSSTTGSRFMRTTVNSAWSLQGGGILQESLGSAVLPSSMTPAAMAATAFFHLGFTQSATL